jgi:hypothetical protein
MEEKKEYKMLGLYEKQSLIPSLIMFVAHAFTSAYSIFCKVSMEDYLIGTNHNALNKKTQTYALGSVFTLFYNFLGFNSFIYTNDLVTYPIGSPGCFYAYDENGELTTEFDEVKKYIDSIKLAHTVTYDKQGNSPDQTIKYLASALGWDLTNSIVENDLMKLFLGKKESSYSGHTVGLSLHETEIEIWRRLVINSAWLWKSKGTRKPIKKLVTRI